MLIILIYIFFKLFLCVSIKLFNVFKIENISKKKMIIKIYKIFFCNLLFIIYIF